MWVLGSDARFSERATRALTYGAISPDPGAYVSKEQSRLILACSFLHILAQCLSAFLCSVASVCRLFYVTLREQSKSFALSVT